MSGNQTRHLRGLAAEDAAARHYQDLGGSVLARRVLTEAGEIDLIAQHDATIIFVEVKARKTLDRSAASLGAAQMARIGASAEIWLAQNPNFAQSDLRFDVVLVDNTGRISVIKNALSFDS